jgi:TIGR03009 family protein
VQRYNCSFTWWEYDSNFGPRDPNAAKTCSEGQIQYEAPDKGLFRVDKLKHYTPQPDGSIQYLVKPGENGTYWTCNGKEIFDFNFGQEQLEVTELPPDMQGSAIANGPLPFLFGAKAETIKQRYWVQIIAPPQGKEGQEHWLQAFPKTRQDAANYKMVEVILDAKLFLPSAIQVYDPSYDGRMNFSRSVFVFHDRKVNERFSVQNLNPLKGDPFTPKTPQGWKRIVRKDSVAAPVSQATPPPQSPDGQAARQPLFGGSRQ